MKTSTRVQKVILSAIIAGCVTMAAIAGGSTGNNNGYYYSLWYNSGSASITFPSGGGNYAISWSKCGDMTGGKGWNPGGSRTVGYNCGVLNNASVFGVYGWTTSPLVEYYICEIGSAANGSHIGSLSSDGHSYSVYHHQQVNQPSIQGTATFWQNIDVWGGSSTGANHSVTTGNHFNYWNSHGMNLGSFNYMILLTEEWNGGSGNSNATVW